MKNHRFWSIFNIFNKGVPYKKSSILNDFRHFLEVSRAKLKVLQRFFLRAFCGAPAMETLNFYDLRPVLETFLTSFPMSLEILNFYESPTVMETEIASFPMYWGLWILRISPCTGDFQFLRFSSVLKTLFFTSFPMYWGLWVFTNFPSILETLHFYEFLSALGTLSFYNFPPVLETLGFHELSHALGALSFYKPPSYTGDFDFTNFPLYRDFKFLRFPLCTGDCLTSFPMYWELWVFTHFPL